MHFGIICEVPTSKAGQFVSPFLSCPDFRFPAGEKDVRFFDLVCRPLRICRRRRLCCSYRIANVMASVDVAEQPKKLKLYSYWLSSCAFRVRIALNLKGLGYEYKAVNIVKGEQFNDEFLKLNPIGFVPALVDDNIVVADSFAILMYLDEKYPEHPLLPRDLQKKAINYQAANIVSSSMQPFQNLAALNDIEEKISPDEKLAWVKHHIGKGFAALEKLLKNHAGKYATGDEVFLADLFLAPQIHAAIDWINLDMTEFPLLSRLNEAYSELPAFQNAMPENQPDAPVEPVG